MNSDQGNLLWGVARFYDLPNAAAMAVLIALLVILERRYPRMRIRLWISALSIVLLDQLVWYLPGAQADHHIPFHTIRLSGELLVGILFLLYEVHPAQVLSARRRLVLISVPALIALQVIYGLDTHTSAPYVVCALAAIVVAVVVQFAFRSRASAITWMTATLVALWIAVALFSLADCFRTAAYMAVGYIFLAAAVNLWGQLSFALVGRAVITSGLFLWSASLLIHPWIMLHPSLRPLAEQVWAMQKFVLAFGMVVTLFEEEARENNHLAHHDAVTGLCNRRRLEDQLQAYVASGHAQVLLIDLNGFKSVNDSFGHAAGDLVLREIGSRLLSLSQAGETLARAGGDEFIMASAHDLLGRRDVIMEKISLPIGVPGGVAEVTSSIGSATYPADAIGQFGSDAVSTLLNVADHRMYRAKDQHRQIAVSSVALDVAVEVL